VSVRFFQNPGIGTMAPASKINHLSNQGGAPALEEKIRTHKYN